MREILFRGKRVEDGEWVYGYVAIHTIIGDETELKTVIVQKPDKIYQYDSWTVDPETVGQYTGLKDKKGKKIFEGDIVKTHFSFNHNVEQEPFIITWNKDKAMFEGVKPEKNKDDYLRCFSFFPEQEFIYEIIGNVHENPELVGCEQK